ncbi:MAG: hypothetical protein IT464_08115 [Planctomycetes bacterium]|nr:hypothetical protein [Planctomycetota bacterium]
MKQWLIALLLLAAPVCTAQVYTVSGGALAYTPLAGGTDLPALVLGSEFEGPIGLTGTASLFGQAFTSFYVSRHGHLAFADQPTPIANGRLFVSHVVAPYWAQLEPGAGSGVQWLESGGELVVEWTAMLQSAAPAPKPALTFQARIDLTTGQVEFRYATGTPAATSGLHRVMLSGEFAATASQPVCFGEQATFVGASGQLSAWPSDRFIRFSAGAGAAPSISVTLGGTAVAQQELLQFSHGVLITNINLELGVADADNDVTSLETSFSTLPAWLIVSAEWQSAPTATPYTVTPSSGRVDNGTDLVLTLIAREGSGTAAAFTFRLEGKSFGSGGDDEEGAGGSCHLAGGSSLPLVLLGLLAWRRRKFRNC